MGEHVVSKRKEDKFEGVSVTNLSLYASPVTFHSNNFVHTKKCMFKIAIATLELTLKAVKHFFIKVP